MQLRKDLPQELLPAAEAAVSWFNDKRGTQFQLTGLVESETALTTDPGEAFELGLILCEGDLCAREHVRVTVNGENFEFASLDVQESAIPALLDPPVGVRRTWLDDQLAKHEFVLLLFYRGRW